MEIDKIEAKEKEFRANLKKMRKNLALRREQANKKNDKRGLNLRIMIPILVIIFVAFYLVEKLISGNESDPPNLQTKINIVEQKSPVPNDESKSQIISEETEKKDAPFSSEVVGDDSGKEEANQKAPITLPEKKEGEYHPEKHSALNSEPQNSSDVSMRHGTKIAKHLVCLGVKGKNCSQPSSIFVLNKNRKAHVWMKIYSDSVPYKLKHVYYHEGKKYVQVPLKIEYRTMRTWSSINLINSTHLGSWRVNIEDEDGNLLETANFEVIAGR